MKKFDLSNMVNDLGYIANGTIIHQFLFSVCYPLPGLKVLEPGCGSAKFSLSYALARCEVTAIDIDVQVVGYAQRLCRAIEVLIGSFAVPPIIAQGDIFNMTEVWTDYFDLVFNEGVPQHWPEDEKRQKCINEMVRVTRPGGTVIIIGNDGTNPDEQKIDESFNFEYMGMPPKRRCFTPMELKDKMVAAGLKDVGIEKLRAGPNLALIGGYGRKG